MPQVGAAAVGCGGDHSAARHQARGLVAVEHLERGQLFARPATTGVDAVNREREAGLGVAVVGRDVGTVAFGQVHAVVFGKAARAVDDQVFDPDVHRALVVDQDLGVGTGDELGVAGDVVAKQLHVATAGAHVLHGEKGTRHVVLRHDLELPRNVGVFFQRGKTFAHQAFQVERNFGLDKGAHLGNVPVVLQLVVEAVEIRRTGGGQVFGPDAVADVALGLARIERPVGVDHNDLLVAVARFKQPAEG